MTTLHTKKEINQNSAIDGADLIDLNLIERSDCRTQTSVNYSMFLSFGKGKREKIHKIDTHKYRTNAIRSTIMNDVQSGQSHRIN